MDLKQYYEAMRKVRESIREDYPVVISLETADGGRAGVATEVSAEVAAKMVIEGRARIADAKESAAYRSEKAAARREAEERDAASRLQVRVVSEQDLRALKRGGERGS